jgi:hypothetical protein
VSSIQLISAGSGMIVGDLTSVLYGPEEVAEVVNLLGDVEGRDKSHLGVTLDSSLVGNLCGDLRKDLVGDGKVPQVEDMGTYAMEEMVSKNQLIPDTRFNCRI